MDILKTILPVMIAIGIGMLCRHRNILTRDGINALKQVVVTITLPAVLLSAFATTAYSLRDVLIPVLMFGICLAAWALGKLAGKLFHMESKLVPFLTTGFEAGMLGYALFRMLFGNSRTAEFAILDLGQVLFVFTVFKILLGRMENGRMNGKQILKEMVLSPIILSIVAGVLIGATGLYQMLVPSGISMVFDACTEFLSGPTSILILLTIGYDLVLKDVSWKAVGKVIAIRLVIMAVLCACLIGILKLLWPDLNLTDAAIVMFLLPPPFVLPVFADNADQRAYVSSVLSVYTLVSVAGFAVMAIIR